MIIMMMVVIIIIIIINDNNFRKKDRDLKYRFHPVDFRLLFYFVRDNNLPIFPINTVEPVVVETLVG